MSAGIYAEINSAKNPLPLAFEESPGSPRYNASYTEESPDFTEQGGG